MSQGHELLTVAQMGRADRAAIDGGVPGTTLMENAGRAVAEAVRTRFAQGTVVVLCGPGNNGGDGFVAARHLKAMGWTVRLGLLGSVDKLRGDAAHHAGLWDGPVELLSPELLDGADVAVDALFGAGLSRPLDGAPRAVVEALNARVLPTVAVDVPSGLAGDDGQVLGEVAVQAACTVTFFRKKPGHLLLPGRGYCGPVVLADIGIPARVLATACADTDGPATFENAPALVAERWPWRATGDHKYRFGHALVLGGATATGAGRLACRAALRVGAGLVTIAAPTTALPIYAQETAAVITVPLDDDVQLDRLLSDARLNALLLGPGAGVGDATRDRAHKLLATGRAVVLDADALTSFAGACDELAAAVWGPTVLTPHEGEFARLFPDTEGDKLARARTAARRTGAVVLLKGADTVIAAPDGRAAINANAPPELATAGAGDVLAGLVAGALAQGLPAFEGTCAAAWLHGEAARGFGPGLIADDLPDRVPAALVALQQDA
ncbi:bifunctional ADP-dependent NAD(P)H-hydrate dehydratase/NAD(P)H-hydrate epimerase [Rhodovibrio salinarum]|uniref:Bifunctional NAD(P)H-hydrate repair enzyme n=1 Tax=Rhodovibrio salinarum TaxID=1087 RepID=A0A934QIS4_9PROT|nr:bifunctional ADP-dependent NAD(P)H-hydrate dehydratase/NAD(P)H-hydrate epimerase [Rhodovibrio salinarum]MBK1697654.1 bifunctional ADP-dependent NAD(P)H-hydrate dehydratase/NAD(P)H-hydrate epimerase [Rhodovibrio salinarum]